MIDRDCNTGICEICGMTYAKKANNSKTCSKECNKKRISLYGKKRYAEGQKIIRKIIRKKQGIKSLWNDDDEYVIPEHIPLKYPHTLLKL